MISSFEKDFDYILLDSPAGLESGFRLAASNCDTCIIITTPDAVSIRAASYASQNIKKTGSANVRLVVNKFNKKIHKNVNVDDFIDTVGAQLLGIIPESTEVYQSVNGKKIPYDCKGNQAFLRISKRITGESISFKANLL
jgi:septum site-determining protein MinD